MKLAYVRTSKHDRDATIARLAEAGAAGGWQVQKGVALPSGGTIYQVCKPDWVESLMKKTPELIGLMPCSIAILERDNHIVVASGSAAILGELSSDSDLHRLAAEGDAALRALVNAVADVGEPKPVSVKLYSTHSCPYCRMEKTWLESKKVPHTVVYVDDDEKEAHRLVERTGQRGVPVTEIEYDSADPDFIIGFDKKRLEAILPTN